MRRLLALMVVGLFATQATALDWYARGEHTDPDWDPITVPLTLQSGVHYSGSTSGLPNDDTIYQFKIATADWSTSAPNNNSRVVANAAGGITFHLYDQTSWSDGWLPNNSRRVGFDDPLKFGWDLMGSFNGFSAPLALTSQGSGLYSGQFPLNAGITEYKFRKANDWNLNVGTIFSNDSNNNIITVANTGDVWQFDLDLPNGRFRAFSVDQHGDYNGDGNTDAGDYVWWRKNNPNSPAKYTEWRSNFGRTTNLTWIAHSLAAGDTTMADQGGGHYKADITGLTPYSDYEYRVVRSDLSSQYPVSNVKIRANPDGEIHLHYYDLQTPSWTDGWSPTNVSRVGYQDSGTFGWEIMGSFNGWTTGMALADQGGGLYTGSFSFDTADTYYFKFRQQGSWDFSVGSDFGNSAPTADNPFVVAAPGDIWNFELDLPNGRWRAYHPTSGLSAGQVPEPASLALVLFGVAIMGLARRR